jgi:predicted SnoaL-like aldol condensation-catalyzing enzyme
VEGAQLLGRVTADDPVHAAEPRAGTGSAGAWAESGRVVTAQDLARIGPSTRFERGLPAQLGEGLYARSGSIVRATLIRSGVSILVTSENTGRRRAVVSRGTGQAHSSKLRFRLPTESYRIRIGYKEDIGMSTEENKELVRRWNEEGVTRPDKHKAFLHEAYTVHSGSEGRWPTYGGRDALEAHLREYLADHPTFAVVLDDIIAEGDMVAVRATLMEEGRPTDNHMAFYRIADGKIVEDWSCSTEIEQ